MTTIIIITITKNTYNSLSSWAYSNYEGETDHSVKSSIFWDTTPCSPLKFNQRFGGTCRLDLQERRINRTRNQCHLVHDAFLLGSFFSPEDGDEVFLRKIS
jgi:hypothetical protein